MSLQPVTSQTFNQVLADHPRVVIKIGTDWCAPCKAMAPRLEMLATEYQDTLPFFEYNATEEVERTYAKQTLNLMTVPTILYYENAELVRSFVGVAPDQGLNKYLKDQA